MSDYTGPYHLSDGVAKEEAETRNDKLNGFRPGTMGCHEVLHMTAFIENAVKTELYQHPAIQSDPDWLLEVDRILISLRRLYQLIGNKHLSA